MIRSIKSLLFYIVVFVGVLSVLMTLLSMMYDVRHWWIKVLDFPREQVLIVIVLCCTFFLLFNKRWSFWPLFFMIGLFSAACLQAYFILPYTVFTPKKAVWASPEEVNPEAKLSLLSANVYMKNRNAEALLSILKDIDPDMVLLMETDQWWEEALNGIQKDYPFQMEHPLDNTYGMLLYSKHPLIDAEIKFFQHKDVPSFHTKVKLNNGAKFYFHGVHPVPPTRSEYPDNIGEKEEGLLSVGDLVSTHQLPAVVAGDFNDVAWSHTNRLFQENTQLNDLRIGRGLYNTFNAQSFWMRWPLDHVYVSDDFKVIEFRRLDEFGSDHFPIFVELLLPK